MRKFLSFFIAFAFVAFASAQAFAQFAGVKSEKKIAEIALLQPGSFSWTLDILNVSDDQAAGEITWNESTIIANQYRWTNALQYARINSTITQTGAAIQVYTDNMNSTTTYQYVPFADISTDAISAGGLVPTSKNTDGETVGNLLPFAWRLTDKKGELEVNPTKTDQGQTPENEAIEFASLYFKDKGSTLTDADNTPFTNGEDYVTILKAGSGFRWGGGSGDIGGAASGTFYMYFGADFGSASTPNTYGTDTLTFEGFVE